MNSTPSQTPVPASPSMKSWQAGIGAVVFAVVLVVYFMLSQALGLTEPWAAILWLFCWTSIEESRPSSALPSVVGMAVGVAVAWLLRAAPEALGTPGAIAAIALLLILLARTLMNGAKGYIVNRTMWAFVTVVTNPWILKQVSFPQVYLHLAVGIAFFCVLFLGVPKLLAWSAARRGSAR